MFKDYDKFFSVSMKVYSFVLLIIFILKLVGLDYFGMDVNNSTLLKLNDFIISSHLENVWYAVSLYLNIYIIVSITTNDHSRKLKLIVLACMPLYAIIQINKDGNVIFLLFDYIYMLGLSLIYLNKKFKVRNLVNYILFTLLVLLFQMISIVFRNNSLEVLMDNFIINFIYNLDYLILMLMFHHIYFKKGYESICIMVASSSSQKLTSLKKYLTKLRKRFQNNKKNKSKKKKKEISKEEKISNIIYTILYLIWNLFTLFLIILVALLNDTIVECIFIIFSFWVTKTVFGKAFHFESVLKCFVVSNLAYYLLNKITAPLGLSIFIPILLGVGLSYVTSKFVKKTYKPLYRGMPEDVFEDTILHVVEKDSTKYNICREFYIDNVSDLSLSFKYNYSVAGIRKIKDRVNEKIKEL